MRRAHSCGVCGGKGHNRQSCPVQVNVNLLTQTQAGPSGAHTKEYVDGLFGDDGDSDGNEDNFYVNVDMVIIII